MLVTIVKMIAAKLGPSNPMETDNTDSDSTHPDGQAVLRQAQAMQAIAFQLGKLVKENGDLVKLRKEEAQIRRDGRPLI